MPPSPLPPARTLSDWRLASRAWRPALLRGCHLGPSPPRAAWTRTDCSELFVLCKCREKPVPFWVRLAARTTSAFGGCDYSPRRRCHRARILTGVAATGTKPQSGGKSCILGSPMPRRSREANLFMMLGYASGDHWMAKTTPSLMLRTMMTSATSEDVVPFGEDKAKGAIPQGNGRVRPRTKESCSQSRSSSSEDPTMHVQHHWGILLQKASC